MLDKNNYQNNIKQFRVREGKTAVTDCIEEIHFISSFSISTLDKKVGIWYT